MFRKFAVSLVLAFAVGPILCPSARAEETPPVTASRPASAIRVALLPVIAGWSDGDADSRREKANQGTEELVRLFADRGFGIVAAAEIDRAAAGLKLDMAEATQRTATNLDKLAKAVGADWIVLVAVTNLKQERVRAPITDTDELVTTATMQTWAIDRTESRTLLGGEPSACPVHSDPGSRKPRNVVAGAVREALRAVLAPYPVKKDRAD